MKGEAQVAHVLDANHFLPPSRHSQLTSFMNLRITDRELPRQRRHKCQKSYVYHLLYRTKWDTEFSSAPALSHLTPAARVGDICCCCQGFQNVWLKICRSVEILVIILYFAEKCFVRLNLYLFRVQDIFLQPMFWVWEQWWDNGPTLYSWGWPDHSDVTDTMITMDRGASSGIMRSPRCHLRLPDYNEAPWVTWVTMFYQVSAESLPRIGAWVSCLGILISAVRGGQARGILIRLLRYWRRRQYWDIRQTMLERALGSVGSDKSAQKF